MQRLFTRYRRPSRGLIWVVAVALYGGQVLADQHLHEDDVSEADCVLCALSAAEPVLDCGTGGHRKNIWPLTDCASLYSPALVSNPFENHRSRAPPIS